ncbi:aspartyl-tRNA synthetase, partial [Listeria ivanovii FSL F6-596]
SNLDSFFIKNHHLILEYFLLEFYLLISLDWNHWTKMDRPILSLHRS